MVRYLKILKDKYYLAYIKINGVFYFFINFIKRLIKIINNFNNHDGVKK